MPGDRRQQRIPARLGIEVGVKINEPRRNHVALCVDLAVPRVIDLADLGDGAAVDRDIAGEGFRTGAVDNVAAPDDEIVGHCVFPIALVRESCPD